MIYPWQEKHWNMLGSLIKAKSLPHALLIAGTKGLGQFEFAWFLLKSLLCQQRNHLFQACQSCHACQLVDSHTHPDVLLIQAEEKQNLIKVDQIRLSTDFAYQSSFQGGYRIIFIYPADAMNQNAANALLKILEEPPKNVIFLLVADEASRLLPTIRSRCQHIFLKKLKKEESLDWLRQEVKNNFKEYQAIDLSLVLQLAHGAPMQALDLLRNMSWQKYITLLTQLETLKQAKLEPLHFAAQLNDADTIPLIDCLILLTLDVIKLQLGSSFSFIYHQDKKNFLCCLQQETRLDANILLINFLNRQRQLLAQGANLNNQLLLESIIFKWMDSFQCF